MVSRGDAACAALTKPSPKARANRVIAGAIVFLSPACRFPRIQESPSSLHAKIKGHFADVFPGNLPLRRLWPHALLGQKLGSHGRNDIQESQAGIGQREQRPLRAVIGMVDAQIGSGRRGGDGELAFVVSNVAQRQSRKYPLNSGSNE